MNKSQVIRKKLPDSPGVYTFRDYKNKPIYIGRATSLKDRVRSYFADDLIKTRGPRIVDMVTKAKKLDWEKTDSVLEAILLEGKLIKQYQPFYNVDERDDKSSQYVVITKEEWPRVFLERARDFDISMKENRLHYKVMNVYGPFPEIGLIKESLRILRKLFPFRDKKAIDPRHESFYRALGRSPEGNDEASLKSYKKNIEYLCLFFEGKSGKVKSLIEGDMKRYAKNLQFEKAADSRKLLYAITHINDIALIKRNAVTNTNGTGKYFRIEAFDVAHLSGTNVVGSMTVNINGQRANNEYRRFKISKEVNDDLRGLAEILMRRLNHTEWPYPDVIVVDGNMNHKKVAEAVLASRRLDIPVVAVTKDEGHKAAKFIGQNEILSLHLNSIISANAEAHRFAISYHRQKRNKIM